MSAGTHATAKNDAKPRRRTIWIFGGAATAVIVGGLLMQYLRGNPAAAETAGTARVGNPKSTLLAKVGKENISYDAVAEECYRRHGREVLDDIIHRMIITQACEEERINVTEQEVTQEISRIADRFKLDPGAYLQMLQTERNVSEMQYRTSVIWPMLALKKLAGEKVDITEPELQKAFERNYGTRVKARVITIDNPRRGNEVWEMAKQDPDNFDQLAQKHSTDPNSRALGGQIPPIPRHMGNDALEKEAFKLKEGDISGVIEISKGRYAILKCEGRTVPIVTDIEEVRDSLYDELKEAKTQLAVGKTFEKIKERTRVDNYVTGAVNGPDRAVPAKATGTANGAVQPASATQPRSTRPATTNTPGAANTTPAAATAPARTTRN